MNNFYFVILNYNNYTDTVECVESLINSVPTTNIIIVDNNSSDASGLLLKEKFNKCVLLLLDTNDGYAAGNNVGITYAIKAGAEYICVLNNDVTLPENFVIEALKAFNECVDLDIIGPLICEYSNPNYVQSAGAMMKLHIGRGFFLHMGELADECDLTGDQPDYLSGACFVARKKVFTDLGLLPELYFLYYEETDWFFLAQEKHINFSCNVRLRAYHKGSATVSMLHGISRYYLTRNQVIFERRKANCYQFLSFMLYSFFRWIYHFAKTHKSVFSLKAFYDGLRFNLPK